MTQKMRIASVSLAVIAALGVVSASTEMVLQIEDYATMPITGTLEPCSGQCNLASLARVNYVVEEPGGGNRFFVPDLNGPLYILDKSTRTFTPYLDFNGRDKRPGLFRRFSFEQGRSNGLGSFVFDPDYKRTGKFYTVHMEDSDVNAPSAPDNKTLPALNVSGYLPTASIGAPGLPVMECVVIEWTDTDISNAKFEGTAREILRLQMTGRSHPMGELIFNPTARPGDPEWRVMYIAQGDNASGESNTPFWINPQRLDILLGKILRIIPDVNEHASTSMLSDNGRYRIPNDNPFVSKAGARKEIWAYGFRNPHRLSWAVDPASPANNRLIANVIGARTWEAVFIIKKGINYGWAQREGNEVLMRTGKTGPLPAVDKIPVYIHDTPTDETLVPTYPVVQYGHVPGGGDAIGNGYVYRGKNLPALQGKFLFTDLSTGHVWYMDYKEMLAADDGNPNTMAEMHEVKLAWNDPNDTQDAGERIYDTMSPITLAAYHFRGGKDPRGPSSAPVSGPGRADPRIAVDAAGELYIYTKSDGMIRQVIGAK